jgi:hypothetical protein
VRATKTHRISVLIFDFCPYKGGPYDLSRQLAVVIIREIGIISGVVTVGITDVVSHRPGCSGITGITVIPNFLDFKNWYHRWAGITTPYHVFSWNIMTTAS